MKIYTAHYKLYEDDFYAPHNRKMFLNREDADKYLDNLINYQGINRYYILEETVYEQYSPINYEEKSDWECFYGTTHSYTDSCDCDYPCDITNEF